MSPEGGSRGRTTEIIVALAIAIVITIASIDVTTEWKILTIVILATIGILNLVYLMGLWSKRDGLTKEERAREHAILGHPEFMVDLHRLNERLWNLLYVRYGDRPCLMVSGEQILAEFDDPPAKVEFDNYVKIMHVSYKGIYEQIKSRGQGYIWKTYDFVEIMRDVSAHFELMNIIFDFFNRVAQTPLSKPATNRVRSLWEQFRIDYNTLLQEWKNFTDRFDKTILYGTETRARPADPWPEA